MCLHNNDTNKAKYYAQQGLITGNFLKHLIKTRKAYDKNIPLSEKEVDNNTISIGVRRNKKRKIENRHEDEVLHVLSN